MKKRILYVEDNPGDVRLTKEAFREKGIKHEVTVVSDGIAAMECLRRKGPYVNVRRPQLILLDLNLPGKDGRELLEEIKSDGDLKLIPVVILSSSESEQDVQHAYNYRANCFIKKPSNYDDYLSIVQQIGDFWFRVASLPVIN